MAARLNDALRALSDLVESPGGLRQSVRVSPDRPRVMAGLVPAIYASTASAWLAGTSPAMTGMRFHPGKCGARLGQPDRKPLWLTGAAPTLGAPAGSRVRRGAELKTLFIIAWTGLGKQAAGSGRPLPILCARSN